MVEPAAQPGTSPPGERPALEPVPRTDPNTAPIESSYAPLRHFDRLTDRVSFLPGLLDPVFAGCPTAEPLEPGGRLL